MAVEITVQNNDEFQEIINNKDFRISEAIVSGILNNIDSKKKNVHVLSITCLDEDSVYDITIERKYFAETLEENLPHYVREEKYEECRTIANTIEMLKNQYVSDIIKNISKPKK